MDFFSSLHKVSWIEGLLYCIDEVFLAEPLGDVETETQIGLG